MKNKLTLLTLMVLLSGSAAAGTNWTAPVYKGDTRLSAKIAPPNWARMGDSPAVCVSAHIRRKALFKTWEACTDSGVTPVNLGIYYPKLKLIHRTGQSKCNKIVYRRGDIAVVETQLYTFLGGNKWYGPYGPTYRPHAIRACYNKR